MLRLYFRVGCDDLRSGEDLAASGLDVKGRSGGGEGKQGSFCVCVNNVWWVSEAF